MLSTRITTSNQGTSRSSNAMLETTTKGFAGSHGTQPWTTPLSTRGKRPLTLTYRWFRLSKTTALVASTRTNLKIATMMKGGQKSPKIQNRKNRSNIIKLQKCLIPIATLEVVLLLPSPLTGTLVHCRVTSPPNGRSITGEPLTRPSSCRAMTSSKMALKSAVAPSVPISLKTRL